MRCFSGKPPLRIAGHVLFGICVAVLFGFLFGWVAMLAWNAVMPALFGLPLVTYWQAVALLILARLAVGHIGHGGYHRRRRFRRSDSGDGAALYTAWWAEEGEDSFKAFAARHMGESGPSR